MRKWREGGVLGSDMAIDLICLDADDTLWHNMRYFDGAERALFGILQPFADAQVARERLQEVSARNLALYGYGVKSFTLSMIETATELCTEAPPASVVRKILEIGRDLLRHPVVLLPGVEAVLDALAKRMRLVLVTKGDLFHQEAKLGSSGLKDRFSGVEIISEKTAHSFRRIFADYGVAPERCAMVGDSMRSDVLPALEAGAWAALVPPDIVWFYERAIAPVDHPRFKTLETLADLPNWIDGIA
jgi:putative hydrolase of the HAD superfamily